MTNKLYEIMMGSLLGDGCLCLNSIRSKNAMFKIKQCEKFEKYVHYLYKQFDSYVSCEVRMGISKKPSRRDGKIIHSLEEWNGEYCKHYYFWTKCNPDFTKIWEKWYKNKTKCVPSDLKLTPRILAHWFVQDGQNNVCSKKRCKSVILHTQAFSENETQFLVDCLKNEFNITAKTCRTKKGMIIRISAKSYFHFMKIVSKYVKEFGDCFDYKIDISLAPKDKQGKYWSGPILNREKANNIRKLRSEGFSLKNLANTFNVGVSTISKIVNNQMYKESGINITGKAATKVGYKYGN
jgi:hypothetical protein